MEEMIQVIVDSVSYEAQGSMYRVNLKEQATGKVLPIFVGAFEGNAIAIALRGIPTARPLTHDLIASVIQGLEGRVMRVVVADLRENIYYAFIYIQQDGREMAIDSRPSDAIALAMRVGVPIFVVKKLQNKFLDEFEEILTKTDSGETVH
ncbi:MAG: bifunctional nuclease family protein [Thermodesulfobacteriota bacterium]